MMEMKEARDDSINKMNAYMYPKIFHIYISLYYIFISFFCYFDLFLPSLSLTKKQNKLKAKLQTYQSVHIHNLQVGI